MKQYIWIVLVCGEPKNDAGLTESIAYNIRVENQPWLVSIGYFVENTWIQQCIGSIITNKHILTTSTCLFDNLKLSIRIGVTDLNDINEGILKKSHEFMEKSNPYLNLRIIFLRGIFFYKIDIHHCYFDKTDRSAMLWSIQGVFMLMIMKSHCEKFSQFKSNLTF